MFPCRPGRTPAARPLLTCRGLLPVSQRHGSRYVAVLCVPLHHRRWNPRSTPLPGNIGHRRRPSTATPALAAPRTTGVLRGEQRKNFPRQPWHLVHTDRPRKVRSAIEGGTAMKQRLARSAAAMVTSGCVALAGCWSSAGTANADNGPPQPHRWCPGQSLWITGNHVTNPVHWDESICHTYYVVYWGQGNVAQNIWDGPDPPPPPPPPPPGLNFCPIPPWCP